MMKENGKTPIKQGEIIPPTRNVGIRVGNQIYTPALPVDEQHARALQGCMDAHTGALIALDRFYATAAAFTARRTVVWQPATELAAQAEEAKEVEHQRAVAEIRREQELVEAETKVVMAKHRREAAEVFKEEKFELGRARFAEKTAKHGVGEAVARASMQGDQPEPEQPKAPPSIANLIIENLEAVEKEIDEAEASGAATENLRHQVHVLTSMLRRELKKAK